MKRLVFLAGAGCCALALAARPASARNGVWARAADLPEPRQAFGIAAIGNDVFVVGGYSARGQRLNQMYDAARDRWTERAPLPAALNYPSAGAVGGKLYVFGGFAETFGVTPGLARGDGYRYDPHADAWERVAPMPTWRAGFALIENRGSLYAIGGRGKLDVNANERYNPGDDSWDTLEPLPGPRDQLAGATLRGEIHVTGGRAYELGGNSARHDIYDAGQDAWRAGTDLPKTRSGHAAAVLDGRLVLFGGESNEGMDADVIAFDPDVSTWQSLATMPHARHGLGAVSVNGTAYAIGGSTGFGLADASSLNETFEL